MCASDVDVSGTLNGQDLQFMQQYLNEWFDSFEEIENKSKEWSVVNVSYDLNKGQGYAPKELYGEQIISFYDPTRPGYDFLGWFQYDTGNKTVGEKVEVEYISSLPTGTTLIAMWKRKTAQY